MKKMAYLMNGKLAYRDITPDEIEEIERQSETIEYESALDERIADLEEALDLILNGVTA